LYQRLKLSGFILSAISSMDSFWTLSGVLGLFRVSGEPEVIRIYVLCLRWVPSV
jgi:hypothetical protein